MAIPNQFQTATEKPIASYSGVDIATGRGLTNFYAGDYVSGALLLSPIVFQSNTGGVGAGVNTAMTKNFDCQFFRPLQVGGTAIVTIPFLLQDTSGGAFVDTKVTATLAHVSPGGVQLNLISGQYILNSVISIPAGENQFRNCTFGLVLPKTKFEVNSKFRLMIETTAPGANKNVVLLFDPAGRPINSSSVETLHLTDMANASNTAGAITYGVNPVLKLQLPIIIDL